MITTAFLAAGSQIAAAGGDAGIFDLVNTKSAEAQSSLIQIGGVIAIFFVMYKAVAVRGAIAGVIAGAFAAAVFLFIINNVDSLKNRVGDEVNGLGTSVSTVHISAAPPDHLTHHEAS